VKRITIGAAFLLALAAIPVAAAQELAPQMVRFEPHNGAFIIPVVMNGVLTEKFIVDSGAADVSISGAVAVALKKSGTLTDADLLGSKKYRMADGSIVPSQIYRVASLRVGDMVVHDVTVRVAAEKSDLLLGQSFLRRLKSWSMDNARQVMILN
jgi:clan AA aspartic protease (TIGR02281 family)